MCHGSSKTNEASIEPFSTCCTPPTSLGLAAIPALQMKLSKGKVK
jgi:hypothetical protein